MARFGNPPPWKRYKFFSILLGLCLIWLWLGGGEVRAGILSDRLSTFPQWNTKPPIASAQGDLIYPDWMAGTWQVSSVLVEMVAPLAPEIVTPGFESNRRYLNQPVHFKVRFQADRAQPRTRNLIPSSPALSTASGGGAKLLNQPIIADRAFNGLNIGKAYLGEKGILSVKVDPNNPNRQITFLSGDKQLVSIVTNRGSETPHPNQFIATEVAQQVFQGNSQIYLNEVETTTAYHFLSSGKDPDSLPKKIEAEQVTAIYLSPQDPNYFATVGRPVALYRYRLELLPTEQ